MAKTVVLNIVVNDTELVELEKGLEELGADFKVVEDGAKKVKKGTEDLKLSSKVITKLDALTGGWASSIIDVANGLQDVVKGLNLSRTALIATGIGAFVVALGTIVAYWEDITNWVTDTNVALERQLELNKEIELSLERQAQRRKDNASFLDNETKIAVLRAKIAGASEEEIAEIRRQGLENRIADLEKEAQEADRILQNSIGASEEAYQDALKNQMEVYDALANARGNLAIFDLEQQLPEEKKREKQQKVNPLTGEDLDAEKEALNARFEELFGIQNTWESTMLERQNEFANTQVAINARKNKEMAESDRVMSEYREWLAEQEAMAKTESYMLAANGFMAASQLIGQETAAGKALAVASTLISTYLSAQQAYQSQLTIPTPDAPIRAAAAAAVAVVSGLANVKQILSTKVPGYEGSVGSVGASASTPPAFNVVGTSPQNQLNQALLGQANEPVQAFVVEGEVSTAQQLQRNKVSASSLG